MPVSKRRREQEDDERFREGFRNLHEKGAHEFRLLWLKVNEEAVRAFIRHGYGDDLERRGRMASALSESLYKALLHARNAYTKHATSDAVGAKEE